MQLLDKYLRSNKIVHLCQTCLTSLGTFANCVRFYCPSSNYPAISYCTIFPFFAHCDTTIYRIPYYILIITTYTHQSVQLEKGLELKDFNFCLLFLYIATNHKLHTIMLFSLKIMSHFWFVCLLFADCPN